MFSPVTYKHTVMKWVLTWKCETWLLTLREEHRFRVFENRVLWRTFVPLRDEVAEKQRRLHNEELYALCASPNVIWVINSRTLRWAGHVACMGGRGKVHTGFWWENLREGDRLEDSGIAGRIICKRIFEK
jgi:hypothetical protein